MSAHLTDSELLCFCGLVRLLVRLDGQITFEERQAIEQIGPEMAVLPNPIEAPYRDNPNTDDGVDLRRPIGAPYRSAAPDRGAVPICAPGGRPTARFWDTMDQAAKVFRDDESVRRAALGVTRQEARQEIYVAVYDLAVCDTISKPEWSLLDWLSSQWDVRC